MAHTRINKTTVKYSHVDDVITKQNLTVKERMRETVYYFGGKDIVGSKEITERDGFIETLSHVSECATCLNNYAVQYIIQIYVNHTTKPYSTANYSHGHYIQETGIVDYLHYDLALKCSRAHDMVAYSN